MYNYVFAISYKSHSPASLLSFFLLKLYLNTTLCEANHACAYIIVTSIGPIPTVNAQRLLPFQHPVFAKKISQKTHSTYTDIQTIIMYTIINLQIIPTTHGFLVCAVAW